MDTKNNEQRLERIYSILVGFLTRVDKSSRPHPELLEMTRDTVHRFVEEAYALGQIEFCVCASQITAMINNMSENLQPVEECLVELRRYHAELAAEWDMRLPLVDGEHPPLSHQQEAGSPSQPPPSGEVEACGVSAAESAISETGDDAGADETGNFRYVGSEEFALDLDLSSIFIADLDEQIPVIENLMLELEGASQREEIIRQLFRIVHTIKGNAGFLGLREYKDLGHAIEHYLEPFRDQKAGTKELSVDLMLESIDTLKQLTVNFRSRLNTLTKSDTPQDIAAIDWVSVTNRLHLENSNRSD